MLAPAAAIGLLVCPVSVVLTGGPANRAQAALPPEGYILVGSDGGVFAFGQQAFAGSMADHPLAAPIVAAGDSPDAGGYWLAGRDRGVFAFGNAPFHGSQDNTSFAPCPPMIGCGARPYIFPNSNPAVGFADEPPNGYAIAMSDGGAYGYDAGIAWPMPGLVAPIVGIAYSPIGSGVWEAGADGGVFAQGAVFYGSLGGQPLAAPIVGIIGTPDGNGYWLVGADGGVFSFGDAPFLGSLPGLGIRPVSPIVGMASTRDGRGYWLAGADGGVFALGDAPYLGGMAGRTLNAPVVAIAAP
jgi:hypothetical protein